MTDEFDDLEALSESFSQMLGEEWPKEKAIAFDRTGDAIAAVLWTAMAELGWTALTAPEAHGGLGLGLDAAARLHAALGAATVPAPMLGSLLAIELVATAGNEAQQAEWLPKLADGSLRVALSQPGDAPLIADGKTVRGTAPDVLDARPADLFFLRASRGGMPCWIAVDATAKGVTVEPHPLVDTSRTLGTLHLDAVPLGEHHCIIPKNAEALDDRLLRYGCVALAADAVGGGEAVLAGTIEYLKVREQFGRLIGSFQALKHRVADHQTALVAARTLMLHAAGLAEDHPAALLTALSAKANVTRVVAEISRDCIQLFGGVGFTSEYFPHLYLKRAKLNEVLFGTRIALLDRVADMLEAR